MGTLQLLGRLMNNAGVREMELYAADAVAAKALPTLVAEADRLAPQAAGRAGKALASAALHVDGKEAYAAIESTIKSAKRSVSIETSTFSADKTGRRIGRLLMAKRKEGVQVRLLIDAMGSDIHVPNAQRFYRQLSKAGVDIRLHNPKILTVRGMPITHRKLIIADGKRFLTGGMNIGENYARKWHDLMVSIEGPQAREAVRAFNRNWVRAGGKAIPLPKKMATASGLKLLINDPESKRFQLTDKVLRELQTAKKSIQVQMPYISDSRFMKALSEAKLRGVNVEVLMPRLNDEKAYLELNQHTAQKLLNQGIKVRWYDGATTPGVMRERFSHTKFILIDGRKAILGSANADARSMAGNHEVGLFVRNRQVVADAKNRVWRPDWQSSKPVDPASLAPKGIVGHARRMIYRLLAPIL